MAKTLRTELFQSPAHSSGFSGQPNTLQNSLMEQRYLDLRSQVSILSEQMAKMVTQVNEWNRATKAQFEKMQGLIQQLADNDQALSHETAQRMTQLHSRIGERQNVDAKIQEMVDRHNTVLKSYELRMLQMNRLIQEKEAQVVSAQAALNETKMELARLKRL